MCGNFDTALIVECAGTVNLRLGMVVVMMVRVLVWVSVGMWVWGKVICGEDGMEMGARVERK